MAIRQLDEEKIIQFTHGSVCPETQAGGEHHSPDTRHFQEVSPLHPIIHRFSLQ
jgi:hypothetical protein